MHGAGRRSRRASLGRKGKGGGRAGRRRKGDPLAATPPDRSGTGSSDGSDVAYLVATTRGGQYGISLPEGSTERQRRAAGTELLALPDGELDDLMQTRRGDAAEPSGSSQPPEDSVMGRGIITFSNMPTPETHTETHTPHETPLRRREQDHHSDADPTPRGRLLNVASAIRRGVRLGKAETQRREHMQEADSLRASVSEYDSRTPSRSGTEADWEGSFTGDAEREKLIARLQDAERRAVEAEAAVARIRSTTGEEDLRRIQSVVGRQGDELEAAKQLQRKQRQAERVLEERQFAGARVDRAQRVEAAVRAKMKSWDEFEKQKVKEEEKLRAILQAHRTQLVELEELLAGSNAVGSGVEAARAVARERVNQLRNKLIPAAREIIEKKQKERRDAVPVLTPEEERAWRGIQAQEKEAARAKAEEEREVRRRQDKEQVRQYWAKKKKVKDTPPGSAPVTALNADDAKGGPLHASPLPSRQSSAADSGNADTLALIEGFRGTLGGARKPQNTCSPLGTGKRQRAGSLSFRAATVNRLTLTSSTVSALVCLVVSTKQKSRTRISITEVEEQSGSPRSRSSVGPLLSPKRGSVGQAADEGTGTPSTPSTLTALAATIRTILGDCASGIPGSLRSARSSRVQLSPRRPSTLAAGSAEQAAPSLQEAVASLHAASSLHHGSGNSLADIVVETRSNSPTHMQPLLTPVNIDIFTPDAPGISLSATPLPDAVAAAPAEEGAAALAAVVASVAVLVQAAEPSRPPTSGDTSSTVELRDREDDFWTKIALQGEVLTAAGAPRHADAQEDEFSRAEDPLAVYVRASVARQREIDSARNYDPVMGSVRRADVQRGFAERLRQRLAVERSDDPWATIEGAGSDLVRGTGCEFWSRLWPETYGRPALRRVQPVQEPEAAESGLRAVRTKHPQMWSQQPPPPRDRHVKAKQLCVNFRDAGGLQVVIRARLGALVTRFRGVGREHRRMQLLWSSPTRKGRIQGPLMLEVRETVAILSAQVITKQDRDDRFALPSRARALARARTISVGLRLTDGPVPPDRPAARGSWAVLGAIAELALTAGTVLLGGPWPPPAPGGLGRPDASNPRKSNAPTSPLAGTAPRLLVS
eukprot:TRINITY_DN3713_c0_g2_i1.p1 TRINITY_DN3713_c0_g2~~TRINITY_DN3713_c0_g2_i1.p1  ORF type:complete len:1107 (+),score=311.52 TRINITY_DN3713_c0_g2_i1:55-3375(+)